MVHPLYLDEEFYRGAFGDRPQLLGSTPYDLDALRAWDRRSRKTLPLRGDELLCVVVY
jgi:hypothetical protein